MAHMHSTGYIALSRANISSREGRKITVSDYCEDCGAKLRNYIRRFCPSCQYERMKKREAKEAKR